MYTRYGAPEVLSVRDVPEPARSPRHARVKVHAAALNPKDVLVRKGKMRWLVGGGLPRTPGYDLAGVLLDDAGGLPSGTEVFAMINSHAGGACAEIVSLPFDEVAEKPRTLSMIEAAALPLAGLTALQALRDELALERGQSVLVNGASGGVGTLAVQIAKALGASVTAVCSARNAELVRELGAARVLDYTVEPLHALRDFDAVFDVFGSFPWSAARHTLRPGGRFCTTVPRPASILRGGLRRLGLHRAALVVVRSRRRDLDVLRAMVDDGALRPVVDRVVTLADSAEGHRHLETRRARGKVVVTLDASRTE